MELKVAVAQIDIALGDAEANLRTVQNSAAEAAASGAQLLVLPELWGSGYDLGHANHLADEINTGLFGSMTALARHHRLAICGSLLEWNPETEQAYNTAYWYDAEGALRGTYRKVHRFGLMQEDRFLGAGDSTPLLNLPWGPTALAICYDLRFPELFRRYTLDGALLVVIPAEWPVQRIAHWRTLLQARAIENQIFVVACNRVGKDAANQFGGCSAIIDPWGAVLAEAHDHPALLTATLDFSVVEEVRSRIPALMDRRPEIYKLGDEQ
ncbi:MAG: carbon-nitrogen family hydrolase [Herpetosiphonaceae bacterium]|nr:carbon-nitrogen family hydrolase [Herpetosiphonaceae bacterium]